jgi:hypothetical protein
MHVSPDPGEKNPRYLKKLNTSLKFGALLVRNTCLYVTPPTPIDVHTDPQLIGGQWKFPGLPVWPRSLGRWIFFFFVGKGYESAAIFKIDINQQQY